MPNLSIIPCFLIGVKILYCNFKREQSVLVEPIRYPRWIVVIKFAGDTVTIRVIYRQKFGGRTDDDKCYKF